MGWSSVLMGRCISAISTTSDSALDLKTKQTTTIAAKRNRGRGDGGLRQAALNMPHELRFDRWATCMSLNVTNHPQD
jgi:hypothetical protein